MRRWMALLLGCLCVFGAAAAEEALWEEAPVREVMRGAQSVQLTTSGGMVEISTTVIDGETWLFLPTFADAQALDSALSDGTPVSVMQSENLRTLFLFSADPVNEGRAYIDNCERHVNATTGSMALVDQDGNVDHADSLRQLRGRGNYTWKQSKKPYQFKLETRADLLDTGDPAERSRTWVLLADVADATLLRSRLTLDLALELGMDNTSHSEPVDLYYDGEYRGVYLLCEKVEVGSGRLDVDDYEETIEAWNEHAGTAPLETLPVGMAQNRYGTAFTFIEGVTESGQPQDGSFVLEMEHPTNTLSDRCWMLLSDGTVIASKNPENASESMMRYISERMDELRMALESGGDLSEVMDVEAFARLTLLNELAYNLDAYYYSSSWFVLPAGESRFEPGTAWDFDLAWSYLKQGHNAEGRGLKDADTNGWFRLFYKNPAFFEAMQRIYRDELYPLVENILLGDGQGRYLQSLSAYDAHIAAARRMNDQLWQREPYKPHVYGENAQEDVALLRSFIQGRNRWLYQAMMAGRETVTLWGHAAYLNTENDLLLYSAPWNPVVIESVEWQPLTEATEDGFAVWQLEALLRPTGDTSITGAILNGTPLTVEETDGGLLRLCAAFEDPSYRPIEYDGEDVGYVYNADYYAAHYPEVAAACGDDPDEMLAYFCDYGMEEDQCANGFFRPSEVLDGNPELLGVMGTDWHLYYWDFLYYGLEEGWMRNVGTRYALAVQDMLN